MEVLERTVDVPPEDLERKTKNGQTIFENDVHWCKAYLVKAGYIDSSKRDVWTLTGNRRTAKLDDGLISEIFRTVQKESRNTSEKQETPELVPTEIEDVESDVDLEYRTEVLTRLRSLTPVGFEHFCQELLLEAGFEDVEVTGRSGDRGIDSQGILKITPLYLMKVAFQTKRYIDSVGSGVAHDFRASVVGRADRGLLITTGNFTRGA